MTDPYIVARSDQHNYPVSPGDNRVLVYYYASAGAILSKATLDGQPKFIGSGMERGHPVFSLDVELPRGQVRRVVLQLTEPETPGTPDIPRQPLVRPMQVSEIILPCR